MRGGGGGGGGGGREGGVNDIHNPVKEATVQTLGQTVSSSDRLMEGGDNMKHKHITDKKLYYVSCKVRVKRSLHIL